MFVPPCVLIESVTSLFSEFTLTSMGWAWKACKTYVCDWPGPMGALTTPAVAPLMKLIRVAGGTAAVGTLAGSVGGCDESVGSEVGDVGEEGVGGAVVGVALRAMAS